MTVLGIDPVREPALHDMPLASGRLLTAADVQSALITETLATQEYLGVGDSITLNGTVAAGPQAYRVVGIVQGSGPLPDAGGRLVFIPLASAQTLFATTGVSRVDLGADAGTSVEELIGNLETTISSEPYLLSRQSDLADSLRTEMADFRSALLLVAAVVLFAGAFLIFNTLSMTVAERSREIGLLRAAGATRSQVVSFVLLQALVLGIVGSVLGVLGGVGLAALTLSWVESSGPIALAAPSISAGSVALALLIGVMVTLAASLEPAWRASRIPPVEALRRGPSGHGSAGSQAALARPGLRGPGGDGPGDVARWQRSPGDWGRGRGQRLRHVGSARGLRLAARHGPARAASSRPFPAGGRHPVPGLPQRGAPGAQLPGSRPSRTALTAGALVVGLAMVVALGTAAQDVRKIGSSWLAETIPGSELLTSIRPVAITDPIRDQLAAMPGVKSVSPIGLFGVPYQGVARKRPPSWAATTWPTVGWSSLRAAVTGRQP